MSIILYNVDMKNKNLTIFNAGLVFVLAFIIAQFTSIIGISVTEVIMGVVGKSADQITAFWDTAWGTLLQTIYMDIAFVVIFVWYYKHLNKQHLFQKPSNQTLKYVGISVVIGMATLFLLSGVLNYFQLFVDKLGFTSSVLPYNIKSTKNYIISLISLALIPAVCEEILFRGVIVNALKHKGYWFAIVLSSIMFSIFHFSPAQLIYPICFGLILAIVYLKTNNIVFPILLHFINNAFSLSIQYFSNSSAPFVHSTSALIYAIITLIIWIGIMCWMFKDFKTSVVDKEKDNNQPTQPNEANTIQQDSNNNQPAQNDRLKFDNLVFYGSIAIMLCIYCLLLSL